MIERCVTNYLILNWKTGEIRVIKRKPNPSKLGAHDIPIKLDITIRIPERQELTMKAEVKLGQAQVEQIALDAFEESA